MSGPWFYCVKHNAVEKAGECAAIDRLGPYDTEAEARLALERAAQRTQQWDAEDEKWENG